MGGRALSGFMEPGPKVAMAKTFAPKQIPNHVKEGQFNALIPRVMILVGMGPYWTAKR